MKLKKIYMYLQTSFIFQSVELGSCIFGHITTLGAE